MSEFKVGDLVALKSGGPRMTITGLGDSAGKPLIWCTWFESYAEPKNSTFPPEALKLLRD